MRDMNLENPLMQNSDSWLQMLMQNLVSRVSQIWVSQNESIAVFIMLTIIAGILLVCLCINFHRINLIYKVASILLLLAYFCYSIWISVNWMNWQEVSPFDLTISIIGGLVTGSIVTYFARRIIKGSVSSQEQEVQFNKGQEAQFNRGQEAHDKKEYESAITLFRELALIKGHVESQFFLGKFYDGSKEDSVKAMEYYSYAAYQGHAEAQFHLAKLYMKSKDFDKAKFWFDEAMKSGWFFNFVMIKNKIRTRKGKLSKDEIADAEYNIGKMYEEKEERKERNYE